MYGVCDTYCEGCIYLAKASEVYCDYICATDRRRPCPAGYGCTERVRTPGFKRDSRLRFVERITREAHAAEEAKRLRKDAPPKAEKQKYEWHPSPEYWHNYKIAHAEKLKAEGKTWGQGEAVYKWRKKVKLSQSELGKLLGYSGSAVSDWERGYYQVPKSALLALEALGCKMPERKKQ